MIENQVLLITQAIMVLLLSATHWSIIITTDLLLARSCTEQIIICHSRQLLAVLAGYYYC